MSGRSPTREQTARAGAKSRLERGKAEARRAISFLDHRQTSNGERSAALCDLWPRPVAGAPFRARPQGQSTIRFSSSGAPITAIASPAAEAAVAAAAASA